MEDYDVYNEMGVLRNRKSLLIVEDDEQFVIEKLLSYGYEIVPIRFSYDLSCFSDEYVNKTKELFTFYYNDNNTFENELLRLKKHFVHYQRKPFLAYIPIGDKYSKLRELLNEIGIKCINDKNLLLEVINKPKLIFIDVDETIKNSNGFISNRIKQAIKSNIDIGNYIIITTSRPRYQSLEIMKEIGASKYVISSNGSEIMDAETENILFSEYINYDEVIKIVKYAFSNNIRLILTTDNQELVTMNVRNSNQILITKENFENDLLHYKIKQCMFIDKNEKIIKKVREKYLTNTFVNIVDDNIGNDLYKEKWVSLVNINCSKGIALKALADYLKIPIENTIAIGNDKNDISMFEVAGLSVAVNNSQDYIKKMVDMVTLSNNDEGVAIFLEKLL